MVVIVNRGAQQKEASQEKPQIYYAARQVFDGRRMRKAVQRRTIDYFSDVVRYVEDRTWRRNVQTDEFFLQPDNSYAKNMMAPYGMQSLPVNSITTRFVHTSINKVRCPIYVCKWTPEGRRLITGAASGELTLWNGLTFNFETILQAHDEAVYSMVWSHDDNWMVTGDHGGKIKYWQSNMNNVKEFAAHKDPVRDIAFAPTDIKFVSCSDDSMVKVWDFRTATEERTLSGHGWDVKCVDWHPTKGLIVSGGKDNQIKLWDPRTANQLQTLHLHKNTVLGVKWNKNGNWLLSGGRDNLCKLFDIRMMREVATFKGHKKEVQSIAWHPIYETLFASGAADGSIMFWLVGGETGYKEKHTKTSTVYSEAAGLDRAHEHSVWSLDWHPLGHMLVSASGDHATRFWARSRPGDALRDRDRDRQGLGGHEDDGFLDYDDQSKQFIPGLEESDMGNYVPQPSKMPPPDRDRDRDRDRGRDRGRDNRDRRDNRDPRDPRGRRDAPRPPPPQQQQHQQQQQPGPAGGAAQGQVRPGAPAPAPATATATQAGQMFPMPMMPMQPAGMMPIGGIPPPGMWPVQMPPGVPPPGMMPMMFGPPPGAMPGQPGMVNPQMMAMHMQQQQQQQQQQDQQGQGGGAWPKQGQPRPGPY